jgi:hypothetical protein
VDVHFKIEPRIKNDCRKKSTFKHLKKIATAVSRVSQNKIAGTFFVPAIYFAGFSRKKFALKPARPY